MKERHHSERREPDNETGPHEETAAPEKTVTIPAAEYETLKHAQKERDSFYDKFVRSHAEFENARKRLDREKSDFLKFASSEFVLKLLPIMDNLDVAMRHLKDAQDVAAVKEGMAMIQNDVQKFLSEIGVEKIKTVGQKFDPLFHDALEFSDAEGDEGTVVEELKAGYALNGKMIRPAVVKIIKRHTDKNGG